MLKRQLSLVLVTIFLLSTAVPMVSAQSHVPGFNIETAWTFDTSNQQIHAYQFAFDNAINSTTIEFSTDITHTDEDGNLLHATQATSTVGLTFIDDRTLEVVLPDGVSFADTITIEAGWEGLESTNLTRTIRATVWNQPIADHEVTITTNWNLNHTYEDENGSQRYLLLFNGRGWQERAGTTLSAWELGDGSITIREVGENETTWINLTLEEIWRNETSIDGELRSQYFDAHGWGDLVIVQSDSEMDEMRITGQVTAAHFNRSTVDGIVSERTELEATGILNGTNVDDDSELWINGTVSLLFFERWEVDGEIKYDLNRFEGYADMDLKDGESQFNIDISNIESYEEWQDGVRIGQSESLTGSGTFGFAGEDDEGGDIVVNGTVYSLREASENGLTTDRYLHLDGTFSGDADGSFGVINQIETSGNWQNNNSTEYLVNIILEENWFNLSASAGVNAFQNHNKTWNYEVPHIEWENRTIYRKWESTGFDNDRGDEYPENSPEEIPAEPPETEDGLGEVNISRETGIVPVPLLPGDRVSLLGSDIVYLDIEATSLTQITKDGHILNTTAWIGTYWNTNDSITDSLASGSIVNEGPLAGLLATVSRQLTLPAVNDIPATFTEVQSLERIIYPSIVASNENNPPQIVSIGLVGSLVNEDGVPAHLEVVISDLDWNVVEVVANLSSLGMSAQVQLNDKGKDGDQTIHDDIWTTSVSVLGAEHGEVEISVTATDIWGESDMGVGSLEVHNQAPRLLSWTHVPSLASRGEVIIVNAEAYDLNGVTRVAIDLRDEGGELADLQFNSVVGNWAGEIEIPSGMEPGEQSLDIYLEDDDGASKTVSSTQASGSHFISSADDKDINIMILNQGPIIQVMALEPEEIQEVLNDGDEVTYTLTIQVSDHDGVRWVKADIGDLAPVGSAISWVIMKDNGQDGDVTAGDGIFSVQFDSRRGLPTGAFPITFKAQDDFEMESINAEYVLKVVEEEQNTLDPDGVFGALDNSVVIISIIGMIVVIGAVIALLSFVKKRKENKDNPWVGKQQGEDPWGNQ